MTPIESIEALDIDTRSSVAAIASMRETGWFDRTGTDYRTLIHEVAGVDPETEDERELEYSFRYLVTMSIEHPGHEGPALLKLATSKARTFIETHSYVFAQPDADATPKLDAAGNPKPKKGAKKELAKKVYNEQIKDVEGMTRKSAIEILVAEVGLTPAGASTYYANLKKGKM